MGRKKRRFWYFIPSIICLFMLTAVSLPAAEEKVLRPTAASMDFYGYIEGARAGDEVTVFDRQGVLSGRFALDQEGRYGFLHVYGDDQGTAVDEGADRNEGLIFYLNGSPLTPISREEVLWLGDGQQQRVDFTKGQTN